MNHTFHVRNSCFVCGIRWTGSFRDSASNLNWATRHQQAKGKSARVQTEIHAPRLPTRSSGWVAIKMSFQTSAKRSKQCIQRDMRRGEAKSTPQPLLEKDTPKAPLITFQDSIIDFENMTAEKIERVHRAIGHQVTFSAFIVFVLMQLVASIDNLSPLSVS